jgi:hypothetical protein
MFILAKNIEAVPVQTVTKHSHYMIWNICSNMMIEPKEQVNTSTMDAVAPLMSGMHSKHPRHYKQIKDY